MNWITTVRTDINGDGTGTAGIGWAHEDDAEISGRVSVEAGWADAESACRGMAEALRELADCLDDEAERMVGR